jgi:hypothetical protein
VAAPYPLCVSSLVQKTGMLTCPCTGQPCASPHGMGASEADTSLAESPPAPVQVFRPTFNWIQNLTLLYGLRFSQQVIFWYLLCSQVQVYWSFWGMHCLHLQGWRIN